MGIAAIAGIIIEALPYIAKGGQAAYSFITAAQDVYAKVKDGGEEVTQEDVDRIRALYADLERDFMEDDEA